MLAFAALLAGAAAPVTAAPEQDRQSTVIIRGGTIYDGVSTKPIIGDVVIQGDRIVYVGKTQKNKYKSAQVIDAKGKVVAPGFIDPHSHADRWLTDPDANKRLLTPLLLQGVTTVFVGSDGSGPNGRTDIGAFLGKIEKSEVGVNVATFVGFGAVRRAVLGEDDRRPTPAELDRQKQLVAQGMCEGAFGISTGLFYTPQSYAKTDEVVAMAKEAAVRGGIYDTHQRSESAMTVGLITSMNEVISIGRQANIPVHFSHLKAAGDKRGSAAEMIALIEAARKDGLNVTANQYPYTASNTSLHAAYIPHWALDGGISALTKRAADPETRAKILADMLKVRGNPNERMIVNASQPWNGKRMDEIARDMGLSPEEAALNIVVQTGGKTASISFSMAEGDIKTLMQQPWMTTGSDGGPGAHPRFAGSYGQKYAQYVVKEQTIDLATFINSSSGRVAEYLGLTDRGRLKSGMRADVVVFSPSEYKARATYLEPTLTAVGVDALFVNGVAAVEGGVATGKAAGKPLRHISKPGTCQ